MLSTTPNSPRSVPGWLRRLACAGVLIWATTITVLSSMTPAQLEHFAPFEFWDKAEYFAAFAAGAANLALVLRWSTAWSVKRIAVVTVAAISIFGVSDEIHQLFTPGRSGGDVSDWTADTLGAAAGAWLALQIYARHSRPPLLAAAGD